VPFKKYIAVEIEIYENIENVTSWKYTK